MKITTREDLDDLLALAFEMATVEGLSVRSALLEAIRRWPDYQWEIAADMRYLPAGQTIRPHVSLAAGVPALELA